MTKIAKKSLTTIILAKPRVLQGILSIISLTVLVSTTLIIMNGRAWWIISNSDVPPSKDTSVISIETVDSHPASHTMNLNPPIMSPIDFKKPVLSIKHEILSTSSNHPSTIYASPTNTERYLELVSYTINISVPLPTMPVNENGEQLPFIITNFTVVYTVKLYQVANGSNDPILVQIINKSESFTSSNTPSIKTGSIAWRIPKNEKMLALQDENVKYQHSVSFKLIMTTINGTVGNEQVNYVEMKMEYLPTVGQSFIIRHWTILPDVGLITVGLSLALLPIIAMFVYRRRMLSSFHHENEMK